MKKNIYAGLFMVTLATLMFEILLTRIFSVTMWYHFAFVAISVAMFGMTVGAILVYLFSGYFTEERAKHQLAASCLLFSISIVISFLTQLSIPFIIHKSIVGLYSIVLTYVVISVPFVFSGICVCIALTKFPKHVSKLYAVDLAGAALGCVLLIYTLRITDGPTAVIVIAALASLGAAFFAADKNFNKLFWGALLTCLLLASFSIGNTILSQKQNSLLRVIWVKGAEEDKPLYEKWNLFSRVAVWDDRIGDTPLGWGISSVGKFDQEIRQYYMNIDSSAATIMTHFDGDLDKLKYLKYDITNLAYYLRTDSRALVIGTGGGRDILSALVFQQRSIMGIEINEDILSIVNQKFGDFTGHLDKNPRVLFVNDEARSYVARTKEKFDIIQTSLIDTWAATAAGAFVLTENSLYTVEAWKIFLEHLSPKGILTFSRWYFKDNPGEVYRLASLAVSSLKELGINNPRDHIFIAKCMRGSVEDEPDGIGTIIVSREPLSKADLDKLEHVAQDMRFDIVLSPRFSINETFSSIVSGKDLNAFTSSFPINIAAPTDDNPFFFHMLRLGSFFNAKLLNQGIMSFNMRAIFVLGVLLITVIGLVFLCIILPLLLTTKNMALTTSWPFLTFFMAIGFGFMLVEISQMQRLIIFLGHPVYGLSVVLFALLISSGLGSYSTQKIGNSITGKMPVIFLLSLLVMLSLFGIFTTRILSVFQSAPTMMRILVAVGMLLPLGFFMGMPFPFGMKLASTRVASITPWLWGINGATSVCASVFAVTIALCSGISTTFWIGVICYIVAFALFALVRQQHSAS